MKKGIAYNIIISIVLLISITSLAVSSQEFLAQVINYNVIVDGSKKEFKNPIVIINDSTYIPLREVAETLDMTVDWNETDQTITINHLKKDESVLHPFESNGLWGYMDQEGNQVVPPTYYEANEFSEGLALVKANSGENGQYGFIDETGIVVIDCSYAQASSFHNGAALVSLATRTDEDRWSYIDKQGNRLFDKEFVMAYDFSENYAVVLKEGYGFPVPPTVDIPKRWSYITKTGDYATELDFEEARAFDKGYAVVKNDGKWGLINTDFEFVLPCKYDSIEQLDLERVEP